MRTPRPTTHSRIPTRWYHVRRTQLALDRASRSSCRPGPSRAGTSRWAEVAGLRHGSSFGKHQMRHERPHQLLLHKETSQLASAHQENPDRLVGALLAFALLTGSLASAAPQTVETTLCGLKI